MKARLTNIAICLFFFTVALTARTNTPYYYTGLNNEFDSISQTLLDNEFGRMQAEGDSLALARLAQIADASGNAVLKARALTWEVRVRQLTFAPDSAIDALEKSLQHVPKEYPYDRAMINSLLGRNYERVGRYAKAWAALQDAIPALQEAGDHYALGNAYLLQGLVYEDIYQDKSALECFSQAESAYKLAGYPLNRVYFLKATLLNRTQPKEAVRYYKLAIENGKGDPVITLQSYIGLVYHYLRNDDTVLASEYFTHAKKEYAGMAASKRSAFELMMLTTEVDLLLAKDDEHGAFEALQQMEALLGRSGDDFEPKYYRTLYDTYQRLGNKEKAYLYLQKYVEVYERQVEELRSQEVERTKAVEDIIHQQDLVERLEQKNRFTQQRLYYSIAIIFLLSIIAVFVVRVFMVRARKQRQLAAELRKDMETEKDLTRLREETLKKDISMRTREVTSSSLHLASKNEALQQVYDIVARFAEEEKISAKSAEEIEFVIRQSLRADDDWERFRVSFSAMHPDFVDRLKERGPSLTDNDIQICAYIVMGMRPKQIAELTNVSPASVNTTRYRIRKKLNLDKDESLDDFLRSLNP